VNDPGRIRDDVGDAPPELRELFRDAQKPEPLPPAIDARLSAQVGALGSLPPWSLLKATPWLVGGGVAVLAGAMALVAQRPEPAPQAKPDRPAPISAPAPAVTAPSPPEPRGLQTPRPTRSQAPSEDGLAREAKLLHQAHGVMATDPRKALAIAGEHARRYPQGQLAAERDLILIQALVKLGRHREAEARARALRKRTPNSIYGQRLDTILQDK
jgi:hypothetical protein